MPSGTLVRLQETSITRFCPSCSHQPRYICIWGGVGGDCLPQHLCKHFSYFSQEEHCRWCGDGCEGTALFSCDFCPVGFCESCLTRSVSHLPCGSWWRNSPTGHTITINLARNMDPKDFEKLSEEASWLQCAPISLQS